MNQVLYASTQARSTQDLRPALSAEIPHRCLWVLRARRPLRNQTHERFEGSLWPEFAILATKLTIGRKRSATFLLRLND